jgi:hypothetical protein
LTLTNKQLSWVLAGAISGGLLLLLLVLQGALTTEHNSLAKASAQCVSRGDQCERIAQTSLIAEPENTLSNLAYLVAGLAIGVRALRAGFDRRRVPVLAVGLAFCFLALCSGYYHATLNDIAGAGTVPLCNPHATKLPQYLDIVGVYLALLSLIGYGLDRLLRKRLNWGPYSVLTVLVGLVLALLAWIVPAAGANADTSPIMTGVTIWLVCGVWAVLAGLMIRFEPDAWVVWAVAGLMLVVNVAVSAAMRVWWGFDSDLVFPVLVGLLVGVTVLNLILPSTPSSTPWRLSVAEVGLALAAFTVAIVLRVSDGGSADSHGVFQAKPLCSPEGWLQAHALWHVFSGLALLLTFDLIEKSSVSNIAEDSGPALLPSPGSVATWLARPGDVLGRRWVALMFNVGLSLVSLVFGVVGLMHLGPMALAALVPLIVTIYVWIVTYLPGVVSLESKR